MLFIYVDSRMKNEVVVILLHEKSEIMGINQRRKKSSVEHNATWSTS
jgi:hypothetical protein